LSLYKVVFLSRKSTSFKKTVVTSTRKWFKQKIPSREKLLVVFKKYSFPLIVTAIICVIVTYSLLMQMHKEETSPNIPDIWTGEGKVVVGDAILFCFEDHCELKLNVKNNINETVTIIAAAVYYYDEAWNPRSASSVINVTLEPGEEKNIECYFKNLNYDIIFDYRQNIPRVMYGALVTSAGRVKFNVKMPV